MKLNQEVAEALTGLVEEGPWTPGQFPSRAGMEALIAEGLCSAVILNFQDGWFAANHYGRQVYKDLYPGPQGAATSLNEARSNRQLKAFLGSAAVSLPGKPIGLTVGCGFCLQDHCVGHFPPTR